MAIDYDLITIGGGIAGASLAFVMAKRGFRVLVLESEAKFKDRVRGEQMSSWGVADARTLGIYDILCASGCSNEARWFELSLGPIVMPRRDCIATTPQQLPQIFFYHPAMQEVLITAAQEVGAEVRRDATGRKVEAGSPPRVHLEIDGKARNLSARLVVGADGRTSTVRRWAGFSVIQDPPARMIGGVLLESAAAVPEHCAYFHLAPSSGRGVFLAPLGAGRVRAYLAYPVTDSRRYQGADDFADFVRDSIATGVRGDFYANARIAGPLASFNAADTWVPHPYRDGIVLIGDAAASNDPSFGQGLSLTMRDVRVLSETLTSNDNWDSAAHSYADKHDRHYGVIHKATQLLGRMFYETGEIADARRAKALPLIAEDPTRIPDHFLCGPDLPLDRLLEQRFFGEA